MLALNSQPTPALKMTLTAARFLLGGYNVTRYEITTGDGTTSHKKKNYNVCNSGFTLTKG